MPDFFYRNIVFYTLPILIILATSAPDIAIYPKLIVLARPNPARRLAVLRWMSIANLFVGITQMAMFGYVRLEVIFVWQLVYALFTWHMGVYL